MSDDSCSSALPSESILASVLLLVLVLTFTGCTTAPTRSPQTTSIDMRARIQHAKSATVRIIVNGQPAGTGFIASSTGAVITCFHVVQNITPAPTAANPNQINIGVALNIQVELSTGQLLPATPHPSCVGQGFGPAVARDFFILNIGGQNRPFFKLGAFADAQEGDQIFTCGFPMGIAQPVTATGIISTKWQTADYLASQNQRAVAWLDMTMNKGNSGGPIVLIGNQPEDDRVVGIATFILNPFAQPAEQLLNVVNGFPGNVHIMGVDFAAFGQLVGTALASASMGVSGCVSIDYCKVALP